MKKKIVLFLVGCFTILLLSSCGNKQTSKTDVNNNQGNSQNKVDIVKRDGDKDNFTPKIDDYVYAVVFHSESTEGYYEEARLISFNE